MREEERAAFTSKPSIAPFSFARYVVTSSYLYRERIQADATRAAILDAAGRLFPELGWTKTTIATIADEARVSRETIYATFGNKREILRRLIERAVRGEDPDTPLLQQAAPQAVVRNADPRQLISSFSADIARRLARVAPLVAVVGEASAEDDEAGTLYRKIHQGRRNNLAAVAKALAERGALRRGLTVDDATTLIWRMASPELFLLMTQMERLSVEGYGKALAAELERLLLPDK